jgi:CheY-like chemotaxis protein
LSPARLPDISASLKQKILIVDDEPEAVELVEFNLRQAGFDTTTAADGDEALKKAKAQLPALVVLDLMLPEIDGLEVCKLLRRDSTTAKIPILMLTAKAAEIDRVLGFDGRTQRTVQEFPTLRTALFVSTPLERWFPESAELRRYFMRDWDQETSRDVDQPPAAVLLLRREVLERVGYLDEELWLFYNDVDYSARMRAAGFRTHYLAEARVVHHVGGSTSKFADFLAVWQRDRLRFYRKHHGRLGGLWLKGCVSLTFGDWFVTQIWRRLRRQPADPLRPMWGRYLAFLRS